MAGFLASIPFPFWGDLMTIPIGFYFLIVEMRIIGMVYKNASTKLENSIKLKKLTK
jgi:hypothetical protein